MQLQTVASTERLNFYFFNLRELLAVFYLISLVSCETFDFIDIVNKCDEEIVCDYSLDSIPAIPSAGHTGFYLTHSMKKNKSQRFTEYGSNGWVRFIEGSTRKQLSIFIYQTDSIRKYGSIDSLIVRKLYKRVDYSVDDLKELNYEVHICY
jgi:hypothetical protein